VLTLSGETLQVVDIHADFVKSIAIIDEYIISASSDRLVKVWRDEVVQTIRHHTRPVDAIAISGKQVWTGDSLGKVVEWRFENGLELVGEAQPHETSVTGIHVVEDDIWTTSMDKTAIVEGAKLEHGEHVRCVLAFDNYVVTGADEIWVWEDKRVVSKVPVLDVTSLQRWGDTIVSGGLDATLRFWTIQGGSLEGIELIQIYCIPSLRPKV
jgi:WD40 repeat protein